MNIAGQPNGAEIAFNQRNGANARPLDGLLVVSLEHAIAAPLCTRQLADLGARVIKVERPGSGDFARAYDSRVKGQSSHFVWTNRSKESLALDLKDPTQLEALKKIVAKADVFVQNLAPGGASRMGLSIVLRANCPKLIVCDISGYGSDGPYRNKKAYDLLIQAEAGLLSVTGTMQGRQFDGRHCGRNVRIQLDPRGALATPSHGQSRPYRHIDAGIACRVDELPDVLRI